MMSGDGICQSTANGVAECDEGLPEQGPYSPPIQPFPILHQILTSNLRSSRITTGSPSTWREKRTVLVFITLVMEKTSKSASFQSNTLPLPLLRPGPTPRSSVHPFDCLLRKREFESVPLSGGISHSKKHWRPQ